MYYFKYIHNFFFQKRYELVPKQVKEEEFWRNYFYRVNLIKQSFDLKDLESSQTANGVKPSAKETVKEISNNEEDVNNLPRYLLYLVFEKLKYYYNYLL